MKPAKKEKTEKLIDPEAFRIRMQRDMILKKLKDGGYRVTKQRISIIDAILESDCGSCKEICYQTARHNKKIGTATVYRTINMLEEIGAIDRRNLYRLSDLAEDADKEMVRVRLEDGEELRLTAEEWDQVLQMGLHACGYLKDEKVVSVSKGCMVGV